MALVLLALNIPVRRDVEGLGLKTTSEKS